MVQVSGRKDVSVQMFRMLFNVMIVTVIAISLIVAGCHRAAAPEHELGQVVGTVTLDGEPLVGAEVVFEPDRGPMSLGTTDATGKYQLRYDANFTGAVLGHHVVRVNRIGEPDTEFDTMNLVPSRYNEKTILDANVTSGTNTIDFALKNK